MRLRLPGLFVATACALGACDSTPVQPTPEEPAAGPPASLRVSGAVNRFGAAGQVLPDPFEVTVLDALGVGVPGVSVNFAVTFGEGSLSPSSAVTDRAGKASTSWKLGTEAGTQAVLARAAGFESVEVTAVLQNSLHAWILARPAIANAITWVEGQYHRAFQHWTPAQRADLTRAYELAEGNDFGIQDPLPNLVADQLEDDDYPFTALTVEQAWSLYTAYVGQSLFLDLSGALGWTLEDYTPEELELILAARTFLHTPQYLFEATAAPSAYFITGWVLPAPPDVVNEFVAVNDLVGVDQLDTILRLIEWSRVHMAHFLYGFQAANTELHWQYRGVVPASRVITGTSVEIGTSTRFNHWTAGCHGTNHFYASILKALNIPVEYVVAAGHATPRFPSEDLYLSHGDDPYSAFSRDIDLIPTSELPIDGAQWREWFGPQRTVDERRDNIGRRSAELALQYLPLYVVQRHCYNDVRNGVAREDSAVYGMFERIHTLEELEAMSLWERLDARAAELGMYCG